MADAKGPLSKFAALLMIAWAMLGLLPLFAQMFGANFLPSTEWTSSTSTLGLIGGVGTALLLVWTVRWSEDEHSHSYLKWFAGNVGALFFGY